MFEICNLFEICYLISGISPGGIMDCKLTMNKKKCTCTYEPCSRKGICCECISYHLKSDELPACAFPPEIERTYNRSFEKFVSCYSRNT
ncbi:MAG: DUF6485 family protein [Nitrospirota bacterium]